MVTGSTPVLVHLRQPTRADRRDIGMIANLLIAFATLATFALPALASEMELYCEGRHNAGAGAPVIQTHLWLKITESKGHSTIELQGPEFENRSLVVEQSPTELTATQINVDRSVEQHLVLNRQTLRITYSVRTSPDVDHTFSGICSRYSPQI